MKIQLNVEYQPNGYAMNAKAAIPEAIDASIDSDTVMVGSREYLEDVRFNGKGILLTSRFGSDGKPVSTGIYYYEL